MAAGESCCSKMWPPASGFAQMPMMYAELALPLRLLLPRRSLAPRRPRGDRARARILRPRAHGPTTACTAPWRFAQASEAARPPGDHRCRSNARRRGAPDAARRDAAGICEPVPVADRDTSRARRPPRPAARVRCARDAAGRADRALGRPAGRPAAADVSPPKGSRQRASSPSAARTCSGKTDSSSSSSATACGVIWRWTRALIDLAESLQLGVVATGDVHYHRRERHRLQRRDGRDPPSHDARRLASGPASQQRVLLAAAGRSRRAVQRLSRCCRQ